MTIPELITTVLDSIRRDFYPDRIREFKRDANALTKAIMRFGYECKRRAWEFNANEMLTAIMTVLISMRDKKAEIKYLPIYLEGAIDRHIRTKAEEYNERAKAKKSVPSLVKKLSVGLERVEVVREPTATDLAAAVYRDLKKRKKRAPDCPNPQGITTQKQLL